MTLAWTDETPTQPGWYAYKHPETGKVAVYELRDYKGKLEYDFVGYAGTPMIFIGYPENDTGQWAGPIELPS